MKTPEEIKKGLECCGKEADTCDGCPYVIEFSAECLDDIHEDALAYIRQLEQISLHWQSSMDQVQKALQDNGFGSLEELLQAYGQVKRERDAAVADLNCNWKCAICKRYTDPIDKCPLYGECGYGYRNFEWRGVKEPPKEETSHV